MKSTFSKKKYLVLGSLILLSLFIFKNWFFSFDAEEEYQSMGFSKNHTIKSNKSKKLIPAGFIMGATGHPIGQEGYLDVPLSQQMDLLKEMGLSWYRFDLAGHQERLDPLIAEAKKKNINLLPIIFPPVDVNTETDPEKIRKIAYDYTFALVSRYKGVIKVWELQNELEIFAILKRGEQSLKDRIFQLGSPDGDRKEHFQEERYQRVKALLKGISTGVHDADPQAKRIINAGWLHYGFITRLISDGVDFEIIGWHWYSDMGNITRVKGYINLLKELVKFKKDIWITEGNYWGGSLGDKEAEQSGYFTDTLKQMVSFYPQIKAYFIYELLDEPYFGEANRESHFGMVGIRRGPDNHWKVTTKKQAFYTIMNLIKK